MFCKNRTPLVSVIIPTYNRANYVAEAIESVLAQAYTDYEVILVDDGSTDNTRHVISPYRERVKYIYQDNQGLAAARNVGINAARGKWVALLDSDDIWLPEKLAVQIEGISQNPQLCLHTTNATLFREHIGKDVNLFDFTGFSRLLSGEFSVFERPLCYQMKYGLAWAQCVLVKRQTLIDAGLYDTRLKIYTDLDMFCRIALCGKWGVSKKKLVRIRRNEREPNISRQRIAEPVHSWKTLVYIYDKLSRDQKVSPNERHLVEKKLASCRAALGMELLKAGQKLDARNILRKALKGEMSLRSLFRYMLSFLPSFVTARTVKSWHKLRYGKSFTVTSGNDTN